MSGAATDGVPGRLARCFGLVFPELGPDEIPLASPSSVGTWDSLASINLVAVIEEEFGIQVELEELEEMMSVATVLDLVERRNGR